MADENVAETENVKEQETNEKDKNSEDEVVELTKSEYEKKLNNDLNNLLVKERAKIFKDLGEDDPKKAKELIQKMKNQEEANKTELQKKEEELQAVKGDLTSKDQEIFDLNAKFKAIDLGINTEYVEEAITLAKSKTTEDKDFETSLNEVVDKFPNLKGEKQSKFGTETKDKEEKATKKLNWW